MAWYRSRKKQSGGGGVEILKGSTNPSSAQGSNGQIYLKYGDDPRYTYDSTLGGYVLNDYYLDTEGAPLCEIGGRAYSKTYDGCSIAVTWKTSSFSGPVLISTVSANVAYSYNGTPLGSATIDGVTWYLSGNTYWNNPVTSSNVPIYETDYTPSGSNIQDVIEDVLEASGFISSVNDRAVIGAYAKENGSWQNLFGTDVNDISNVTADTVSIYKGSTTPSSSLGADGNVYFKYGILGALLHFEDSATADEFGNTTWTAVGTATVSTDQHKFGSKSLYLDGDGYVKSLVGDELFNFGSDDFTVTYWIYPTGTDRYPVFAMSSDYRIGSDIFFGQGSANMWLSSSGGWNEINSDPGGNGIGTIPINANEWTHIAYIRKGDTCKIFVNGQLAKSANVSTGASIQWTGNDAFQIGKWGGGMTQYHGYIDEFLVIKGTALWDSAFTPPTQPFSINDLPKVVLDTYAKDNGAWQSLKGTPIDDIAGTVEPT